MTQITVTGLVATTPRHLVTQTGLPITSFRIASPSNRTDSNGRTIAETNWLTVTSFNQLAINVAVSISKGDRVIISGAMRIRDWDNGERAGTSVELEADTIGHDLAYGSSTFSRNAFRTDDGYTTVVQPEIETDVADADPVEESRHSCTCRDCNIN